LIPIAGFKAWMPGTSPGKGICKVDPVQSCSAPAGLAGGGGAAVDQSKAAQHVDRFAQLLVAGGADIA